MKLLAVSDIHGNVEAVHMLRERERNEFAAVIVAGDIGGKAAAEIMNILASFACPVMYVFGNWDNQLPYDTDFGPTCHHLHLRSIECDGWAFAGFSGLPTSWGMNPIAQALKEGATRKGAVALPDDEVLRLNRQELAAVVKGSRVGPNRTVVVTHERLYRVESDLAGVPIFLFGHRHGFKSTTFKGTKFVNVSVLDDPVTVRPSAKTQCTPDDLRNINVGNYTVIEIDGDRFEATPFKFAPRFDGWTECADGTVYGLPWLRGRSLEA